MPAKLLNTTCLGLHTLLPVAALVCVGLTGSTHGADLFVSPDGRDDWTGTLPAPNAAMTDGPFASLDAARDTIRGMKATDRVVPDGIVVKLRGGTYRRSTPFILTPEDSGSPECPITYTAYADEEPVISGGRALHGWQVGADGLWQTTVPDVPRQDWVFRQLFVNGQRRERAQLPNRGKYRVQGTLHPKLPLHDPANVNTGLFWPGDLNPDWANIEDVEVVFLKHWTHARLRLQSIDAGTGAVTFTGGCFRGPAWSTGYFVENVRAGLDEPGEWVLERQTGALTYWPLAGETPDNVSAEAPKATQLWRLEGSAADGRLLQHVTIRGLTFTHTHWRLPEEGYGAPQGEIPIPAAFHAEGMRHCRIEQNRFEHLGTWALELQNGCRDNVIAQNVFDDIGGGGIKIGRTEKRLAPAGRLLPGALCGNNTIEGNTLRDGCRIFFGAVAIWIGQSDRNHIIGNDISGPWQFGISVGWNWNYSPNPATHNIIERNHCHHLGNGELGSFCAIYTLGVSPGTVIRHNLVHHVEGGHGIVLDEGSSGVEVVGNILHHIDASAFSTNYNGIGNIIYNNIFAFAREGLLLRFGDAPRPGSINCNVSYRNIHLLRGCRLFRDQHPWPDFRTVHDFNLYWDAAGEPFRFIDWTLEEWRQKGLDRHSLLEDPKFIDADKADFRLASDSPALQLGFEPLPAALLEQCRTAALEPAKSLDRRERRLGPAVGSQPRAAKAQSSRADGLLFHAAFDGTAQATFAMGNPAPTDDPPAGAIEFVEGIDGQALRLNDGRICYEVEKNLSIPEGTVLFRARPVSWDPPTPDPHWHALICIVEESTRTGNDLIQLFRYPETMQEGRFNFHCAAGHTSASQYFRTESWKRNQWRHIALTWSAGGATQVFFDGRLFRCQTTQIDFPCLLLRKIQLASKGTDYDELRIYSRVLPDHEILALSRTRGVTQVR